MEISDEIAFDRVMMLISGDNKKEGLYPSHSCILAESVTVDEIMGHLVVTNVPCKILLKYTISEGIAELVDDSVQTRFGGVRLPTAIKYSDEIITDFCNLVTVEIHSRDGAFGDNLSVAVAPVLVAVDGSVHLGFNLTHVWCRFG